MGLSMRSATWREPHWIYWLYDAEGALLYVGITNDLDVRFRHHAAEKPWWPDVARRRTHLCVNRFVALEAEAVIIQRDRPAHNVAHGTKPPRPYAGIVR